MRRPLMPDELLAVLDSWEGCAVAVRVLTPPDELVAVFEGRLGGRTDAKRPSAFWPLEAQPGLASSEQCGVYAHTWLVEDAVLRTGESVVQWRQQGAVVNVRRL